MDERVMQFRVGVMVVATLLIAAMLVVIFGELPSLFHGSYTIYVTFSEAPGVTRDTPVRKSGIRIGRVTSVRFADDDTSVLVTAEINANRQIYHDEVCRISTALLAGDASLEFVRPSQPAGPRTPVENGETVRGAPAQSMQSINRLEDRLAQTMNQVGSATNDLSKAMSQISAVLTKNEQHINNIMDQTDSTLAALQTSLENFNDILGKPETRSNLRTTMDHLPETLTKIDNAMTDIGKSAKPLEQTLLNVKEITQALAKRDETGVNRVEAITQELKLLTKDMRKFSELLNSSEGSLGQLIHNPELYQHLNRAVKNIDELTRDLKPIVADARIFTDKIARHPESLGVRGAIQKSPGIK
jgi:phospholipid/cholesterol/gamma-HCH transport system substrate-binding protein